MKIYILTVENTEERHPVKKQIGVCMSKEKAESHLAILREANYEDRILYVRYQGFVDFYRREIVFDDKEYDFREAISDEFDKYKIAANAIQDRYIEKYEIGVLHCYFDIQEIEVDVLE